MGVAYGQVFGKKHSAKQELTDEIPESARGYKRCPRCHKVKPLSDFGSDINHFDGRASCCRECMRVRIPYTYGNYGIELRTNIKISQHEAMNYIDHARTLNRSVSSIDAYVDKETVSLVYHLDSTPNEVIERIR